MIKITKEERKTLLKTYGLCKDTILKNLKQGYCRWPRIVRDGRVKTLAYHNYTAMIQRCYDAQCDSYPDYGGRGIKVCAEWKCDFWSFFKDMGERPSEMHSIDRIDNEKGYSPDNCRWATKQEQANSKRLRKSNKTGYPGITLINSSGKYRVRATLSGERYHLGCFSTLEEAVYHREQYLKQKGGD